MNEAVGYVLVRGSIKIVMRIPTRKILGCYSHDYFDRHSVAVSGGRQAWHGEIRTSSRAFHRQMMP